MAELRIAVVGDSAMWGQGLLQDNKYWSLAAKRIGTYLGRQLVIDDDLIKPRSGAKIQAATGDERSLILPSGRTIKTKETDRADFIDTYPEVFRSEDEMVRFLNPDPAQGGEEPARRLFREIPSTFPTVTYQVSTISTLVHMPRVDLLFLNGGANDLDFEKFLDPTDHRHDFRRTYESQFTKIFYDDFKDLVRTARIKCPNAVIVIPGYYSAFAATPQTGDFDRIKAFFLFHSNKDRADLFFNWFLHEENIPKDLRQVRARSHFGSALGLYLMRKAVAELYEDPKIRGVGLIFVPSGFKPENGVFTPNNYVHQQYKAAEILDSVKDLRVNSYPRKNQIAKMKNLVQKLRELRNALGSSPGAFESQKSFEDERQQLRSELKGPKPLIDALGQDNNSLLSALEDELGRLNHVQIASFVHPNEPGARKYADNIVVRFERHHRITLKDDIVKLATTLNGGKKPQVVSVKNSLKRYGLNPSVGLRACMQHMVVDSLAVEITTRSDSKDELVSAKLHIDPQHDGFDLAYLIEVDRAFTSGTTNLIPLDTFGDMHLSMIKQLRLEDFKPKGYTSPATWKPSVFTLFVNGKEVFKVPMTKAFAPGDSEILPYPHSQ